MIQILLALAAIHSVPQAEAPYFWGPAWVNLGKDSAVRSCWLRIQRSPSGPTVSALYAAGRLVRRNPVDVPPLFESEYAPMVAGMGSAWMVFVETTPGVGSFSYTDYNLIDKRSFESLASGSFQSGDSSAFASTHRFVEYRYRKYRNLQKDPWPGCNFSRVVWRWDSAHRRFTYESASYTNLAMGAGRASPKHGETGGDGWLYRLAGLSEYGLPSGSEVTVYDDSPRAIKLVWHRNTLAYLPIRDGTLETRRKPSLYRSRAGLVLTLHEFDGDGPHRYKVLVQQRPFKLKLLSRASEHEWAPFGELK